MTVEQVAAQLGLPDAAWLRAVIQFESGGNPAAVNSRSGATGLIQFLPSTARSLGTSTDALKRMSVEEQLEYVWRYLSPYAGRLGSPEDLYMAVFQPSAVGAPSGQVLFSRGSLAYDQNRELDLDGDGAITKAEAAARVVALSGWMPDTGGGLFPSLLDLPAGGSIASSSGVWWQSDAVLVGAAVIGAVSLIDLILGD